MPVRLRVSALICEAASVVTPLVGTVASAVCRMQSLVWFSTQAATSSCSEMIVAVTAEVGTTTSPYQPSISALMASSATDQEASAASRRPM